MLKNPYTEVQEQNVPHKLHEIQLCNLATLKT